MRILIVDDERRFATFLARALAAAGLGEADIARSAEEAVERLRASGADLVVTDLRMPGMSGLDLLAEIRRTSPGTAVVLMTAFADVETAREALKRGARDYLVKPFDNDELVALARQVADRQTLARPPAGEDDVVEYAGMVARSAAMRGVFEQIDRVSRSEASVLVLGESGTGKELVAHAIHSSSGRHAGPFIPVNCAAIPTTLIESELFGHVRGAFTGAHASRAGRIESAARVTLFLDEIAEMPLELQSKLLRFLQDHTVYRVGSNDPVVVDTRIVAATNRDLAGEIARKAFREDLYFRLAVVTIHLPALRERREDVRPLVRHLLAKRGRSPDGVSLPALAALESARWPGNVRELENAVEHAIFQAGEGLIEASHLPGALARPSVPAPTAPVATASGAATSLNLETNERLLIEEALRQAVGNKSRAAELLGITRRRLYSRMQLLGMATAEEDVGG